MALAPGATAPGQLDTSAAPPAGAAVREVTPEESRALLQQIQSGGINFGQGNTVSVQGSVVAGDQHNVTIGSYTRAGVIDQRQGVVISGGSAGGSTMVGFNEGGSTINVCAAPSGAPPDPLRQAAAWVEQAAAQAEQRGDEDLALDLRGALLSLQAALKAQQEQKHERRQAKLREARAALGALAADRPALRDVAASLEAVQ